MIRNRPGYQQRRRKDGTLARYWNPCRASASTPKGQPLRPIPADADEAEAARLCRLWTDQLLGELDARSRAGQYDGTISSLIRLYRTSEASPYRALKHSTRIRDYEPSLNLIDRTVGSRAIPMLTGSDFRRWYEAWCKGGHVRRGHGAIRKLRAVLSFGVEGRLEGCATAREIVSLIAFPAPRPRTERMSYAQASAICDKAIEMGSPSIARAIAIAFDTGLRRIHIIGEWSPLRPGEAGGIVSGATKWRGPTAADIVDQVLTPPNIARGKAATPHDLRECALVRKVLAAAPLPEIGPLIVSEATGRPWRENYFASEYRRIARAAGVPDTVWSMDARSGAITEAEAVTDLETARKMAGHSSSRTTQGYVRGDSLETNRRVARARAELRAEKKL